MMEIYRIYKLHSMFILKENSTVPIPVKNELDDICR
jgi:hypothetical protein